MTRKDMEQCISLRNEIAAIEASLKSPKSTYISVFYKDYRTGKGIPKSMTGYDNGETELKILSKRLGKYKHRLKKRLVDAEDFIESIEDSEMRTIMRMYYINGDNQYDIAEKLNYSQTAISSKIKRFWQMQGDTDRTRSKRH